MSLFILPRRHPHDLAEKAGEIVGIFDADLIADLVHLHVRKVKKLAGLLYF